MSNQYKYYAFISYKREDEEWAEWLQNKLEYYRLPSYIKEEYPNTPDYIRPVFRDKTDLGIGMLSKNITDALANSKFLIVICSRNTPKSEWVSKEITTFSEYGRKQNIIPFIVDGEPYSKDPQNECFPECLKEIGRSLSDDILGANINELSRDYSAMKVVSYMLEIDIDKLWKRYLRAEEIEKQKLIEEKRNLQILESRYLTEKANALLNQNDTYEAIKLALKALPQNLEDCTDRPFIHEASYALTKALHSSEYIIHEDSRIMPILTPNDDYIISLSESGMLKIWSTENGKCTQAYQVEPQIYKTPIVNPTENLMSISINKTSFGVLDLNTLEWKIYNTPFNEFKLMGFTPDDKNIMIRTDKQIWLYNLAKGHSSFLASDLHGGYGNYAISSDNKILAANSNQDIVSIRDIATKQVIVERDLFWRINFCGRTISSLQFTPNNKFLIIEVSKLFSKHDNKFKKQYLYWDYTKDRIITRVNKVSATCEPLQSRNYTLYITKGEGRIYDNETAMLTARFKDIRESYGISRDSRLYYTKNYSSQLIIESLSDREAFPFKTISTDHELRKELPNLIRKVSITSYDDNNICYSKNMYNIPDLTWGYPNKKGIRDFYFVNISKSKDNIPKILILNEQKGIIHQGNLVEDKGDGKDYTIDIEIPNRSRFTSIIRPSSLITANSEYFLCHSRHYNTPLYKEREGEIEIWNLKTLNKKILKCGDSEIQLISTFAECDKLISIDNDKIVSIWDLRSMHCINRIELADQPTHADFSNDGLSYFVIDDKDNLTIIDTTTGKIKEVVKVQIPEDLNAVKHINGKIDGKNHLIIFVQKNLIAVHDFINEITKTIAISNSYFSFELSPDGTLLAAARHNGIEGSTISSSKYLETSVDVFEISTGTCIKTINHYTEVECFLFTADSKHLITCTVDLNYNLWKIESLQTIINSAREKYL